MPMQSMTTTVGIETSSNTSEKMISDKDQTTMESSTFKNSNVCPEGMKHDERGVCQKIQPSKDMKVNVKSTTTTTDRYENTSDAPMSKDCPEGMEHDKHGVCQKIQSSEEVDVTVESTTTTTDRYENTTDASMNKDCPEGMEHDEHGVCQEVEPAEDMEVTAKSTTTTDRYENTEDEDMTKDCPKGMERDQRGHCQKIQSFNRMKIAPKSHTDHYENAEDADVTKGCPEGTEADEQGACQEIKPSRSTKTKTDPKAFLKEDGSCPDNYKMIDGRCLYIKSKTNSTVYPGALTVEENVSVAFRPKSRTDESSKVELVPVLPDNSCPEGTVYSEYGLCQKHTHLVKSNPRMKSDGSCPDDFELIDGKCTYKNTKAQSSSMGRTTTVKMIPAFKGTTPMVDTISAEVDQEQSEESTTKRVIIRMSTTPADDASSKEDFSTVVITDDEDQPSSTFSPL